MKGVDFIKTFGPQFPWALMAARKMPAQHRTEVRIRAQMAVDASRKKKRKAQGRARRIARLHTRYGKPLKKVTHATIHVAIDRPAGRSQSHLRVAEPHRV